MNLINLNRASEINKYNREPIITNITERFIYKPTVCTFESVISCVIRDTNGYFKTFRFPTERAFANALSYLELTPNYRCKDLLQFVR